MKILFIDPPFHRFMDFYRFYYPLGLAYMAAVLKKEGHEVLIYDAEHSPDSKSHTWKETLSSYDDYTRALDNEHHPVWQELKDILAEFNPDVAGISMLSVKVPSSLKVAAICKQFNEKITVIVGADHPTVFPDHTLRDPNIDVVVRGEGEATISELVYAIEHQTSLNQVKGICFKDQGVVVHTPPRELIADLDSLPFPDISALMHSETYRPLDFGAIMGSRGCPYACTFCGVYTIWSRKVRFRSVANVMSVIRWLHKQYGTNFFSFRDASFTIDRQRIIELCNCLIKEDLNLKWECTTRPDLLDEELLMLLLQSGCTNIRLGVESGSEKMLKAMKKNIDLNDVRKAAKLLNRHHVYWSAYFLFGTPRETKETIRETVDFINEIDPSFVTLSRFTPIPGTELYLELEHAGLINPGINWGLEGNQRFSTNYIYNITNDEFETIMKDIADIIDKRNHAKSAEMGKSDLRFKA
jgi:radical SAM superfamily enzyme YgiQ (UPF0313 family)